MKNRVIQTLLILSLFGLNRTWAQNIFNKKSKILCEALDQNIKSNTISLAQINENTVKAKKENPNGKEIYIKKDVPLKSYYNPLDERKVPFLRDDQYLSLDSCQRMVKSYCSLIDNGSMKTTNENEITLTLVDYTRPISERRYSIFKINPTKPLESYVLFHIHATHSGESDPEKTGMPIHFSQKGGDNKTSCGATMTTGPSYEGTFGSARRLKGFASEPTTKDIFQQNKVQHVVGLSLSSIYYGNWASTQGCVGVGYEDPVVYGYNCSSGKDTLASLMTAAVGENNFYYINCLDPRLNESPLLKYTEDKLENCPLIKNISL